MVGVVRNAWEEGKHKRDEGGQFSTAGGGGGKATAVADMTAMEEDERWTPEDRDALNAYQGEDYEVINGSLRRGEVSGETAKQVQALDRAFEKADTLKQGEYLFRFLTGFRNMALFKPGTVFEDKGFISTSKDRDYVTEIMGEDESIFIRIEAGKATKGIRLGGGEVDQGEVLLPRNSRFRVKSASSTGTKGVVVMEAI